MSYKVPFYKSTYLKSLKEIDSSNFDSLMKKAIDSLEDRFKALTSRDYTLTVNNSASAIHLAMCALDLKRGDKIICPINSYADIPAAIRHFDSEPIFTDIEDKSYHMSLDSLKDVLKSNKSKKLRAIVITHFAGLQQDISEILELAKDNKLVVIEDFSDMPVLEDGIDVKGDIALFSLNFKLDNTLKGAMLSFNSQEIYSRAKLLRNNGLKNTNRDVSYLYDILDIGCDYRLDNLSAYLLDGLLLDRVKLINRKKEIVDIYFKNLSNLEHVNLPIESKEHRYSYFIVEIDKNRDAFARELKSRGIEVSLQYIPLNFTTYYKQKYALKVFSYPKALNMYQKVLSIPCHGKMSKKDALEVCRAVKEVNSIHI